MIVGICGAGVMGRGIAVSSLLAGHSVAITDVNAGLLSECTAWIGKQLDTAVTKKKINEEQATAFRTRVSTGTDFNLLATAQVVVEAVVERPDVKVAVLTQLESIMSSDAILTTNTSSISIASLAKHLSRPELFAGLHFFNPAHIMKLVEVISAPRTAESTIAFCVALANGLGKSPVVARDVPGFIVNRVARNFYNEAQRIVMEGGATFDQVDMSVKGLGFKMGPFELMNLIGVETNLDVTTSQWQQFYHEPRFQPSLLQKQYVDAGLRFGDVSE